MSRDSTLYIIDSPLEKSSPHCGILFSMYENPMGQLCYWKWSFLTYKLLSACRLCLLAGPHFCRTLSHILQDHDLCFKTNTGEKIRSFVHLHKIYQKLQNSDFQGQLLLFQKCSKTFYLFLLEQYDFRNSTSISPIFNFYASVRKTYLPSFF